MRSSQPFCPVILRRLCRVRLRLDSRAAHRADFPIPNRGLSGSSRALDGYRVHIGFIKGLSQYPSRSYRSETYLFTAKNAKRRQGILI